MNPEHIVYELSRHYVEDTQAELGEALSKTVLGWIRSRSLAQLASATSLFDPLSHGVEQWRVLSQVKAFFSKNNVFTNEQSARAAALASFKEAEATCAETNRRLVDFYDQQESNPDLALKVRKMSAYLHRVLGPAKEFVEDIPRLTRVTSGATSTLPKAKSQPDMKVRKRLVATARCAKYLAALSLLWGYGKLGIKVTSFNRVEFVPKNWKTHRTIACEPTGNLPLQLAFDTFAKEKLWRRARINLWDQSRNQELARIGSIDGSYATVDLKQASDTVAKALVYLLFEGDWIELLCDFRSDFYRVAESYVGGDPVYSIGRYEKFSSMGNGSTFTIETLVFAAACSAVGAKDFSVYGDDIAIRTEYVPALVELLSFLGFTTNEEKSYTDGPFRESCGCDWFRGVNVTPFYVRDWSDKHALVAHNVNGLATVGLPEGRLWAALRRLTTDMRLLQVPYNGSSTSGVWIDTHDAWTGKLLRNSWRISKTEVLAWTPSYRAYVPKKGAAASAQKRSEQLFLWYLGKYHRSVDKPRPQRAEWDVDILVEAGRSTNLTDSFFRKWVRWHPPSTGTPHHIVMWSDFLKHAE